MGYPSYILHDLHILKVKPGLVIGDCGSQDFAASQIPTLNELLKRYFDKEPINKDCMLTAREVFEHIGYNYTCFDVDNRPETKYLNYQSLCFPRKYYGHFDIMMNAGTSEHLVAPISQLFFMHQATKPGGLMYHSVPMFGWGNHGLNNLTPKFWVLLALYNDYEIVDARLSKTHSESMDRGNFFNEYLACIKGLKEYPIDSAEITIVFRKKHNFCFIPPFDVDDPSPSENTERIIRDTLLPFEKMGSITAQEIQEAMNWRHGRPATYKSPVILPTYISNNPETNSNLIEFNGNTYDIQSAYDLADKYYTEGNHNGAKQLLIRIAMAAPKHGECWYQLALIAEAQGLMFLASAMAAHAFKLGQDYPKYRELKIKLMSFCKKSAPLKWALFLIIKHTNDRVRTKLLGFFEKRKFSRALFVSAGGYFSKKHSHKYLNIISNLLYSPQ